MKILIVFAHPEHKSFNGAMLETTIETLKNLGHDLKIADLYRMNFNTSWDRKNFTTSQDASFLKLQLEEIYATENNGFANDINTEQEKVEWCDLMIWQFPLWWFALPAVLKGWVDRVFAMGRFYGAGKFYNDGIFKGKKSLLSVTTGGPAASYEKAGFNGDMNSILRPIQRGILQFVGFTVLQPQTSYAVAHLTNDERKQLLENWSQRLQSIFEKESFDVGRY